ncbi:MAG: hypothetical protein K2Y51_26130 [Gammaproteobacteria bacterium]|nr:hypothetical protein [Gammaproteobacteria bacterium]
MSAQLSLALRDLPAPFQRDSETSRQAAEEIRPRAQSYRAACLGFVYGRGRAGATNEEVGKALGMKIQTVCPRMKELREAGELVDSQMRRETESGRAAVVWIHREFWV